jgi:hypothetical protein
MSSLRPIPFGKVQTMFWSHVGEAPEWFVCDEKIVEAYKFSRCGSATEWMERRCAANIALPDRIIAVGEDGCLYWMRDGTDPIVLDAHGNPDFSRPFEN